MYVLQEKLLACTNRFRLGVTTLQVDMFIVISSTSLCFIGMFLRGRFNFLAVSFDDSLSGRHFPTFFTGQKSLFPLHLCGIFLLTLKQHSILDTASVVMICLKVDVEHAFASTNRAYVAGVPSVWGHFGRWGSPKKCPQTVLRRRKVDRT